MFALIRTYSNPLIYKLINDLIKTEMFNKFIVVVNQKKDKNNTCKRLLNIYDNGVVIPISLSDWGWSKALNVGIKKAIEHAENDDHILTISNEVSIGLKEINELVVASKRQLASCGYCLFEGRQEDSYLVPRNTCSLWNIQLFNSVGLFDEKLDELHGMEDYEMILRAFQKNHLLPYIGPMFVKLKREINSAFIEKTKREIETMKIIENQFPASVVRTVKQHLNDQNMFNANR